MADLEINGVTYRTGKLDAFKQLHVARRIAPLLGKVGPALAGFAAAQAPGEGGMPPAPPSLDDLSRLLAPVADALAALPDADCNYVLQTCLSVCQRQLPGQAGWQVVWNAAAGQLQFQDLDLPTMMRLALRVIQDNLSGFFPARP
jgi:hypothetical protein